MSEDFLPGDGLKSTRPTLPGDRLGTPGPVCVDSDLVTEVAEALGRRPGLESRVVSWASSPSVTHGVGTHRV